MENKLAGLIKAAKERAVKNDFWDYSVRATEYAEWLDQIYRELLAVRSNYLSKNKDERSSHDTN